MDKELNRLLEQIMDSVSGLNKQASNEEKQKILDDINNALYIDPVDVSILIWKGFYHEALEEYDQAIEVYEQVLQIEPNNEIAKDSLKNCNEFKKWDLEDAKVTKEFSPEDYTKTSTSFSTSNSNNLKWLNVYSIVAIKILLLGVIIYAFFQPLIFGYTDTQLPKSYRIQEYNPQQLTINKPSDYNGKSKAEVLNLRKKFVQTSLFNKQDYEPDESTLGQIQDGKPWWGINQIVCSEYNNPKFNKTEGLSAVSKHLNNPNMLVGTVFPFNFYKEYDSIGYCTANYSKTFPKKMEYIKDKNLIIATYDMDKRILKSYINWNGRRRHYFLNLTGLNAKDLGYKYGYAIDLKNIEMTEPVNISTDIHMFRDFVHVGASCGVPGGCNNISPHQTELDYRLLHLPAEMTIKLWKEKPMNPYMKADVYYRIRFEKI